MVVYAHAHFWWLLELPYWFKASFLPKMLAICTGQGEIDNFSPGTYPEIDDSTLGVHYEPLHPDLQ